MTATTLIQITDLHILPEPRHDHDRESLATLAAVCAAVAAEGPEAVLATGDLVDDGSPAAYRRLRPVLETLPVPVHAIPGNHDDPEAMAAWLAGGNVRVGPSVGFGSWRIVLLDTLVPGEAHGALGPERLAALDATLAATSEPHVLVALHHPPGPIGSPLDDVCLRDTGAFHAVLDRHPAVRAVIWGHNHHVHDSRRHGVRRLGTPSTWVQFDARPEAGFRRTGEPPAYRRLVLHDDGRLDTEVVWVAAAA